MSQQNDAKTIAYEDRFKELLVPVNAFLAEAAEDEVYFDLYLESFEGGSASTYGLGGDHPRCDDASLTRVRNIELFDMNELWSEDYEDDAEEAMQANENQESQTAKGGAV